MAAMQPSGRIVASLPRTGKPASSVTWLKIQESSYPFASSAKPVRKKVHISTCLSSFPDMDQRSSSWDRAPLLLQQAVAPQSVHRDRYPLSREALYYGDLVTIPRRLCCARRLHVLPDPLYRYVQREGSIMRRRDTRRLLDHFEVFELLRDFHDHAEALHGLDSAQLHSLLPSAVPAPTCRRPAGRERR
jgi:hypothetical protein